MPPFEPERARRGVIQAQRAVDLLNLSFKLKLETLLEGTSPATTPPHQPHLIRPVNLGFCFRCALIKRLRIDQRGAAKRSEKAGVTGDAVHRDADGKYPRDLYNGPD